MVHELIGIKNNIVSLKNTPGITKDLEEVILSTEYDEFYENVFFKIHLLLARIIILKRVSLIKSLFSNYGEICIKIKELMDDFQKRSQSTTKIESIADMKV